MEADRFPSVGQPGRELVEEDGSLAEACPKREPVRDQGKEGTRAKDGPARKGVAESVEAPSGEIERRGRRGVEQLHEARSRSERVVLDLVDDNPAFRQFGRRRQCHLGGGRSPGDWQSLVVDARDLERVEPRSEHDPDGPIRCRGPGDRPGDPIYRDARDGQRNSATEDDFVAVRGERGWRRHGEGRVKRDQLAEDRGTPELDVVLGVLRRGGVGSAVCQSRIPGVDGRVQDPGIEDVEGGMPERADVAPQERGMIGHPGALGVAKLENGVRRGIRAKREVDVPEQQFPRLVERLVEIHVLTAAVVPAVRIVDDALEGKDAHPVVRIHLPSDLAGVFVARRAGRRRVHQAEEVGVIVGSVSEGTARPVEPVVSQVLLPVRAVEDAQTRTPGGERGCVVLHLEPELNLVQIPARPVRIPVVGVVAVRLLDVLHEIAALNPVHEKTDMPAMEAGQAHAVGDPVGDVFPLERVVAAAVSGVDDVHVARIEERVVGVEGQCVVARVSDRGIVARRMKGAAAVLRSRVVDHAAVPVDERHVERPVAQLLARGPPADRLLGEPDPVLPERSRIGRFAPSHQAFAHRRIGGKRPAQRRRRGIGRLDVVGEDRAGGHGRQRRHVEARTGVAHENVRVAGRRIAPITKLEKRQPVGVLHAR